MQIVENAPCALRREYRLKTRLDVRGPCPLDGVMVMGYVKEPRLD